MLQRYWHFDNNIREDVDKKYVKIETFLKCCGRSSFNFLTLSQNLNFSEYSTTLRLTRGHLNMFSLLNNFCVVINDDCSESPVVGEVLHVIQLDLTSRHSQMMERSCNISQKKYFSIKVKHLLLFVGWGEIWSSLPSVLQNILW